MSQVAHMVSVGADEARRACAGALTAVGARPVDASLVSDVLVEADLRGQHSHGILRLPVIVGRARAGLLDVNAEPAVQRTAAGSAVVDAGFGFGHATAAFAMDLATTLAAECGVAAVAVRRSNHIGMLGYYAEAGARRGYVSLVTTTTEAMVRPHGGRRPMLGTNPLAVGIPARPEPFLLDFSTSATAIGKLIDASQRHLAIPEDWAVDAEGLPTTDPAAALQGSINPFGGVKGYGLGLAVALLAGVLVGAAPNPDVVGTLDTEHVVNKGDLFLALDPLKFPAGAAFTDHASDLLDDLRSSPPAPGVAAVTVPGDRGRARRAQALSAGIDVPVEVWRAVQALAGAGPAVEL